MNHVTSNTTTYQPTTNNDEIRHYPFFSSAVKYGTIAGGLVALFFFILQTTGQADAFFLKYIGYGLLGLVLTFAIGDYDRFLKTGKTFKHGMILGAQISMFAGATLVLINLVTFLLGSELTFSKYGREVGNLPGFVVLGGAVFLEILVVGMIFTFITLQYYKSRKDYNSKS